MWNLSISFWIKRPRLTSTSIIFWIGLLSVVGQSSIYAQDKPAHSPQQECLRIGVYPSIHSAQEQVLSLLRKAYDSAGLCFTEIETPIKRAEVLLAAGQLDGNFSRVSDIVETAPDYLFTVGPPLFTAKGAFLYQSDNDFGCNPEKLTGKHLGYPYGILWIEKNLPKLGMTLLPVNNLSEIPKLIERNRIEAFLFDVDSIKNLAAEMNRIGLSAEYCEWKEVETYHVLHTRHLDKQELLDHAIRQALSETPIN